MLISPQDRAIAPRMQQGDRPWSADEADACVSHFQEVLRAHDGRFTEERRQLLGAIRSIEGHFLPEEISTHAAARGHRLAATTVYRNLPLLIEAGIVRRAPATGRDERGGARYEVVWNRGHHDHLFCSRCGRQVEVHDSAIELLQEAVAKSHGFTLERHHHELVGVCPECQAAAKAVAS